MAIKVKNASAPMVEYHALRGSFGKVKYFVTKAALRDVAENLELAPQMELSFSDRIQRVIDEKRVESEIVPYLLENELRFFNSLVCILLPDTDSDNAFWEFDEYHDESNQPLGGLGKLKIAKNVARVVLDGQHRFLALQQLWKQAKADPSGGNASIEVSLIFVVVDRLGEFGSPQKSVRSRTIEAVRNLFAVLNKTARRVDNTTLLLIDDTNIANVMARKVLEDGLVDEMFVKWLGGENLNPQDVYFTGIHVIRDAICWYLRDHFDQISDDFGSKAERDEALKQFYTSTPGTEVPTIKAIPYIINNCSAFVKWKAILMKCKVDIVQQPGKTELIGSQSKAVKEARQNELSYTVAGQKALFRATIDAFLAQKRRHQASLKAIVGRANAIIDRGFYERSADHTNPFYNVLVGSRGQMLYSEGSVDLARRILGYGFGSESDPESILERYEEYSEGDANVVEDYWKKVHKLWKS